MDKSVIKKYAIWARGELIEKVTQKAYMYGINPNETLDINLRSYNGVLFNDTEIKQRQALIKKIDSEGYPQVIEEVAYTWFNRFIALRFMEVNGYLPSHVRIFSDEDNNFSPQILAEAIHLDFDTVDINKVMEMKEANQEEDLFKYLLIAQCNALSAILPGIFQKIADYTELLLPDYLLREGSVIEQLIKLIPEDNFDVNSENGQVEIIGWLYQYYNTDLFNAIFDGDKSRKSLAATDIPAATQLFTPDWAVRYMVDNSLGRYWMDGHPNSKLSNHLKYYLSVASQDAEIEEKLTSIKKSYSEKKPEDIHVLDCCMGSGHILVYAFDVLMEIYQEYGYSVRESVRNIVENNLYGLDIDDRATQMAYFAIMMKAREYDRRFFSTGIQPNLFSIKESNCVSDDAINVFAANDAQIREQIDAIIHDFKDAKEYGSILKIKRYNFEDLYRRFEELKEDISLFSNEINNELFEIVRIADVMSRKYEVVVTNPPYLASPRMNNRLLDYIKLHYEEGKADFSTVMYLAVQRNFVAENGFVSFITTNSWMFLKSFLKVRLESLRNMSFESIVDYGTELFEGKIGHLPIIAWVARKSNLKTKFHAVRLVDYKYGKRDEKQTEFFNEKNHYYAHQDEFGFIDGSPIDYWISENVIKSFSNPNLESLAEIVSGMTTGDNDKYLRFWSELNVSKIAFGKKNVEDIDLTSTKWIPYHKGGEQRKWYGNHEYVVNWAEKDNFNRAKTTMTHVYLKPCITWSDISGNTFAGRYCFGGFMFDVKGSCAFSNLENLKVLISIFNSKIMPIYVEALNPTTTTQVGDIKRVPYIKPNDDDKKILINCVDECVRISKDEWDSYEFSWDFKTHPLVIGNPETIKEGFDNWCKVTEERIKAVIENERTINNILIRLYGLEEELSSDVNIEDVTLREPDLQREIKSLISYAVGCMFGRYSLDVPGLVYAGGTWNSSNYKKFVPDSDAIIPICDDEYFSDDIMGRFVSFIETVYRKDKLEENLQYIAAALGGNGSARDIIRNYFINDFYADHLKIYQKRPIYWLFDSGKKNGFKCLIYMHRYQPDTIARIRTDYVHEQQARYRTAIEETANRIETASGSDKVKLTKRLNTLKMQNEEIHSYEEKIHHLADQMIDIDLDDGVKKNYEIFKDVLAKIK